MYAYCIQQLREKNIYGRTRACWIFFVCCVVVVGFFFGGGMGGGHHNIQYSYTSYTCTRC